MRYTTAMFILGTAVGVLIVFVLSGIVEEFTGVHSFLIGFFVPMVFIAAGIMIDQKIEGRGRS